MRLDSDSLPPDVIEYVRGLRSDVDALQRQVLPSAGPQTTWCWNGYGENREGYSYPINTKNWWTPEWLALSPITFERAASYVRAEQDSGTPPGVTIWVEVMKEDEYEGTYIEQAYWSHPWKQPWALSPITVTVPMGHRFRVVAQSTLALNVLAFQLWGRGQAGGGYLPILSDGYTAL